MMTRLRRKDPCEIFVSDRIDIFPSRLPNFEPFAFIAFGHLGIVTYETAGTAARLEVSKSTREKTANLSMLENNGFDSSPGFWHKF